MTGIPGRAERAPDRPATDALGGGGAALPPEDPERDSQVDVLYLAGQRPAGQAEWLLITAVDATPGGEFLAEVLPVNGRHAHGGDVLIRLTDQTRHLEPPQVGVSAWAVICGLLIPVADWTQLDPDEWPERIRATTAFAMGMLTELEEHGAGLGAGQLVELDAAAEAPATIVPGLTNGTAGPARQPCR